MIDVSIIIVNLNTRDLLRACLGSIREHGSTAVDREVVVIDNGSSDGSATMVRGEFPEVRLLVNDTNRGFAAPNNAGMKASCGRYVFLLNSDAELSPGALEALVTFLDGHPKAGACGPRLLYPDGRPQPSAKGFPSLWSHVCDMLFLDALFPSSMLFGRQEMRWFDYSREARVDHLMAAAFLVRRDVLETVGLLDERFSIYYNDMDWCWRMRKAGWEVWYTPAATVTHHLGSTVAQVNKRFARFQELYDNTMLFYQKRYGRWAVACYKILLTVGFALRVPLWAFLALYRKDDHSRLMREFAVRSFLLGLRFWKPLPYQDERSPSVPAAHQGV